MDTAKRLRIMKAAEALFGTGCVAEITMDEVAHKAGVGKGTIYRYFKDKDDLFAAVALSGYDELCELVRTERARAADFHECLVNVCAQISKFHERRRKLMHMMQAEERRALRKRGEGRTLWLARRNQMVAALASLLAEGCREGTIRTDFSSQALALFLLGVLRTRGRERCGDEQGSMSDEALVGLFLQGAGTATSTERP